MHVLFLPKWYPGRNDPQLGDFLRKQAQAMGLYAQVSVLHVAPLNDAGALDAQEVEHLDGAWELHCYYRANTAAWKPWRKLVNLLRWWGATRRGWHRLLRERGMPDSLHACILVRPVLAARWFAWRNRLPYVVNEHSSEYLDGTYAAKGMLFHALSKWLFRNAAVVTTVSPWLGDALVGHGLARSPDIVPNVVPGLDRPLPPPGEPGHFFVVADLLDRTKNISGILRALATARERNARLRLTVIGDGPDRAMLRDLAVRLAIGEQVRFLGRLSNHEVLDHLAGATAVVVNSNVETFSVVTGEALALGRPVIATRCGGPEAFITPVNGILIGPRDDAALATAMLTLASGDLPHDPLAIRRSVGDRFSREAVGRALYAIHQRATGHG